MVKRRISVIKENRIYDLYIRQGYPAAAVANICNCSQRSVYQAVRRVRQRWQHQSTLRCGRYHSWLSDDQVQDIRYRRSQGERIQSIAEDYEMAYNSIWAITKEHNPHYLYSENNEEQLPRLRLVSSR
jgi:transposase